MKQFKVILGFELKNFFKNKIYVGVTLFLVAAIAVVMFLPRFLSVTETDAPTDETPNAQSIMVFCEDESFRSFAVSALSQAFEGYKVEPAEGSLEDLKKLVESGAVKCAFSVDPDSFSYKYFVKDMSIYDSNAGTAEEVLTKAVMAKAMLDGGMDAESVESALSVRFTGEVETLGKSQFDNFFYTYIMIFALYMVILLYGQLVATNVASEKSSRAMELLITTSRPTAMMFGKIVASCIAGLVQIALVFGSAVVLYGINKSYFTDVPIVSSIFDIPPHYLGFMILFFVLGFLIYAFLYGSVGSTVSKVEDINTSVMPITLIFIAAFMVVMFSMSSGNIDNPALVVCSYVPFTSPMAMFTRITMSHVEWYEIAVSVAILVASVIGVGVISAKIYRMGVLLYGTPPKLSAILKAIRKA
ncbi:MAG: ABC transporter permease [Clostridia bacterium]|nr:ABC transporter permease [Clostridia bacterium]